MGTLLDILSFIRFETDAEDEAEAETFFVESGLDDISSVNSKKRAYDQMIFKLISRPNLAKDYKSIKQLLNLIPKLFDQMANPLFLADFLTSCLDFDQMLDIQILSLKAIFLLLQKHGLDYPNYYTKLYGLLVPQYQAKTGQTISVFTFSLTEKVKFLRLLDLSLRSPKLPSRLIAAFIKRLIRLVMCSGICHSQADKMFVISFIANMIKRHPRCVRLIHRKNKRTKENLTFESDPYREHEKDPNKARALKSSLWELDSLINCEFDETVRNYCKLFKGDISRKTSFFKCDEFSSANSLDQIAQELDSINIEKEN